MRSLLSLLPYMKPYRLFALLAPLLMALEVAMDLAQPRLLQTVVDEGIANKDLALVLQLGGLMVAAGIIGLAGGVGCTIFATYAGLGFGTDLRRDLFRRIQSFSFGNLDKLETGRLITRLTSDVDQVQEASLMFMRIMVRAPLLMIGSLVMAVLTDPMLSLLIVALSPLLILSLTFTSRRGHDLFLAVQDRLDRVNVILQENLSGVRVVKAFVRAQHEAGRFGAANDALMDQTVRASTLVASVMPVMMLLLNLGVAAVIWFGGWQVEAGRAHVGQILAFVSYLMQMLSSLMMVGMLVMRVAQADASAERIGQVLTAQPEVQDGSNPQLLGEARGSVRFEDVRFDYDGEEAEPVLRGVSFAVEPGETVAILGATGSGKSSLLNLIPRLYDATGGRVMVDGRDVRDLRQEDLRGAVGMVMQNTILFSGTVRDNIRYGRPGASDEEVERAARVAQAHEFIEALPEGYGTLLGQRGVNLSGGQKQRLALARAVLCDPAMLILDDCTSAVDAATEAQIIQGLDALPNRGARLVVAQRIGSVLSADRILVLEDGAIAAEGTHRELLASSPVYREIVRSQLEQGAISNG